MLSLLAAAIASSMGTGPMPAAVENTQSYVVEMPSSVSESPPLSVAVSEAAPREPIGRTSDASGTGSTFFVSARTDENAEYWKIDEAPGD
ncbi:MAG TPA: hypothetical protein VED01_10850 [Burkholderiales bacterium]|nr:hypothetical protein [Burkholderiales bacterium]